MNYQIKDGVLYFYFYGEFDNYHVSNIKDEAILVIETTKPKMVIFDFEEVSFVDSTGIGFLLARYKQLQKRNITMKISNLSKMNRKLCAMSGIFQLIQEQRNEVKL